MADALRLVIAAGANPYAQSRDHLLDALGRLLAAGVAAGTRPARRRPPPTCWPA